MKKLICLLAVLLTLMGMIVFDLLSGGDVNADDSVEQVDDSATARASTPRGRSE